MKGKLLYCHPPVGITPEEFESARITDKVMERIIIKEAKSNQTESKVINIFLMLFNMSR